MNITQKHIQAAEFLVSQQFEGKSQAILAKELGVSRTTLQNWFQDADFQVVLARAHRDWKKQIEHIPYVHRRKRLEALQAMADSEDDSAKKSALLRQIADEVGGDVLEELEELKQRVAQKPDNAVHLPTGTNG